MVLSRITVKTPIKQDKKSQKKTDMSFLKNIFGDNKSEEKQNENVEAKFFTLNNISQFDEIDEISHTKPVVLFKHSTRCIISRTVLKQFDAEFHFPQNFPGVRIDGAKFSRAGDFVNRIVAR